MLEVHRKIEEVVLSLKSDLVDLSKERPGEIPGQLQTLLSRNFFPYDGCTSCLLRSSRPRQRVALPWTSPAVGKFEQPARHLIGKEPLPFPAVSPTSSTVDERAAVSHSADF